MNCGIIDCKVVLKDGNLVSNKQTIYSFNSDIEAPDLHTIQYYNIYKTEEKMVITIKTTKTIYIHRGSCTPCGKMTYKENLEQSQNHF